MSDLIDIERELRAKLEGVTPGTWSLTIPDRGYCSNYIITDAPELAPVEGKNPWTHLIADFDSCAHGESDAGYVVAAQPENIRLLLDELSRLRGREEEQPVAWLIFDKAEGEWWPTALKETADEYISKGHQVRPLIDKGAAS